MSVRCVGEVCQGGVGEVLGRCVGKVCRGGVFCVGCVCWGGVSGVSGMAVGWQLAPLYYPDTLVNPDTCLGNSIVQNASFSLQSNM